MKPDYKKKYKRLKKTLEKWTRAEIMARHGDYIGINFIDYAILETEFRDKIRKKLFGTDNLVELGLKWKILKPKRDKKNRRTK